MNIINICIKLEETMHNKINNAAQHINRTPHWLIKQAIITYLENIEKGNISLDLTLHRNFNNIEIQELILQEDSYQPFRDFSEKILPQTNTRSAITSAWRISETKAVPRLLENARLEPNIKNNTQQLALDLAKKLRHRKPRAARLEIVQNLLQEYSLSSQEGIALMCLAEAILRIPDRATRNALIKDKIIKGNWQSHIGNSSSFFVNATSWGLLITGRLVAIDNRANLYNLLNRMIIKSGEPLIRKGIEIAIRLMGKQFVKGENILQALTNSHDLEAQGFSYSYDMLGEAALTSQDAKAYFISYEQAIEAIGKASNGRGIYEGPGISIKLSALHPRYNRTQYDRVQDELYPRLKSLTLLAQQYDIGLNIDAEEADRLELSLDLLEKLCLEPNLSGWNGIGFVIQAYQKRCPFVIDALIELAKRSKHRLMVRLVKGAYWDTEIKRTQVEGLEDYPVYTRKVYTDISYIACARKLLSVPQFIYPQFATHNAHTLAAVYYLAGKNYYPGQYEFQCLHGMGEILYDQVVGSVSNGKLNRPCRIYAPVGSYETLLAYLVRRLLENGANTSFVNKIANNSLSIDELIADPVDIVDKLAKVEGIIGLSNPKIPLPRNLYGHERLNSVGIDLNNEQNLADLSKELLNNALQPWHAGPMIHENLNQSGQSKKRPIINPAESTDIVGYVRETTEIEVTLALQQAEKAYHSWRYMPIIQRAYILESAATLMENKMHMLIGLLVREAGKTFNNAISEVREAVDFLRYYSSQIKNFNPNMYVPLGPVVCISPWNFPLAIFTGQIAAAVAVGNSVLAKPSEQTPLIAAQVIQIMHDAGIPNGVLQLITGSGKHLGSMLIRDDRISGIIFTGSTTVANLIQQTIAGRINTQQSKSKPIPLIAETGGINTMIVDSSALTEQAVMDIMTSAFDSAGQRCSALRLLCIQEEVAENTLKMLRGAMAEYRIGNPDRLNTDIGPVINADAKNHIETHIKKMLAKGFKIYQPTLTVSPNINRPNLINKTGNFLIPTLIEINRIDELNCEIFGPVLHIVRFAKKNLPLIIDQINASGYGLTLGVHTRIDTTINQFIDRANIGNLYVNRNIVGAVVGVQPFGGEGLSGTGPKAGGPLYLYRLLSSYPEEAFKISLEQYINCSTNNTTLDRNLLEYHQVFTSWINSRTELELAKVFRIFKDRSAVGTTILLTGPTGEYNSYSLLPRRRILCLSDNENDILIQLALVISTGSKALWKENEIHRKIYQSLPVPVQTIISFAVDVFSTDIKFDTVIYHGDETILRAICIKLANLEGPIIPVYSFANGETNILLDQFLLERSLSINTTAAGGNTSLMSMD
ncbi:MAG: trifunctional transcriptional regulator/proline dehydrogenase/L-glutamate gamma-semialdehyde dehydrogenase [Candidatus Dasytiphilus stammeri]